MGSECAPDTGFVPTRGIRRELHSGGQMTRTPDVRAGTSGPRQPPHHQAGEMRVTWDDTGRGGGGGRETLPLNTSPTDRCR